MTVKKRPPLPNGAVVDSSAIMSILDRRPSSSAFLEALLSTQPLFMGAPTYVELSVVVLGRKAAAGLEPLNDLLEALQVKIVEFDVPMAQFAQTGCAEYGKGHSPAGLNMGDLFSFALAMDKKLPLFFEGLDFAQTSVGDAMRMLGYQFDRQHQPLPLRPVPGRGES